MSPPRLPTKTRQRARAFTLLELLVFLSVFMTVASIGFQPMFNLMEQRKLRSASLELAGYLEVARNVAMAANAPCTISLNNPSGGEFEIGRAHV